MVKSFSGKEDMNIEYHSIAETGLAQQDDHLARHRGPEIKHDHDNTTTRVRGRMDTRLYHQEVVEQYCNLVQHSERTSERI